MHGAYKSIINQSSRTYMYILCPRGLTRKATTGPWPPVNEHAGLAAKLRPQPVYRFSRWVNKWPRTLVDRWWGALICLSFHARLARRLSSSSVIALALHRNRNSSSSHPHPGPAIILHITTTCADVNSTSKLVYFYRAMLCLSAVFAVGRCPYQSINRFIEKW